MGDDVFFDTNVIAYVFDENEKEKGRLASELVMNVFNKKATGIISNQVLFELVLVLTRKLKKPLTKIMAENLVESFIVSENWKKVNYTHDTIKQAFDLVDKYNIPFVDAVIASTAKSNGVSKIMTENEKDFRKIPGIVAINPFKK